MQGGHETQMSENDANSQQIGAQPTVQSKVAQMMALNGFLAHAMRKFPTSTHADGNVKSRQPRKRKKETSKNRRAIPFVSTSSKITESRYMN